MFGGSEALYFLKSAPEGHGRILIEGEFNAMSEIYKWALDLVLRPHSLGKYSPEQPEVYFFLSQYINVSGESPEPNQLCARLARLHHKSLSADGHFGFHITICLARVPQLLSWEPSWTTIFIRLLKRVLKMDLEANGYWEELDELGNRRFGGRRLDY